MSFLDKAKPVTQNQASSTGLSFQSKIRPVAEPIPVATQPIEQKDPNNMVQKFIVNTIGRPAIRLSGAIAGGAINAFGSEEQKQRFDTINAQPTKLPLGFGTVTPQKGFSSPSETSFESSKKPNLGKLTAGSGFKKVLSDPAIKQIALEGGKSLFDSTTLGGGGAIEKGITKVAEKAVSPLVKAIGPGKIGNIAAKTLPKTLTRATEGIGYNAGYNVLNDKKATENIGVAAGFGVGVPAVIGGATKTLGKIKSFIKPGSEDIVKAVDSLESKYTELFTGTKSIKNKFDRSQALTGVKNNSGTTGKTPQRLLAENGVIPKQQGSKLDTLAQAEEFRNTTEPLREANRAAIKQAEYSVPKVPVSQIEYEAVARINSSSLTSAQKEAQISKLRSEFAATRAEYGNALSLTQMDDIKSAHWKATKFDTAVPQLDRDLQYSIAKSYQKSIEDSASKAGYEDVAQLNREIGDRLEAAKFLESLNGNTVKGGKLGLYFSRIIGMGLGSQSMIPGGAIFGAIGGDVIARTLMNNSITTPAKRIILKHLETKDPEAYQAALKWLEKQGKLKDLRIKLPSPKSLGSMGNPIITPAPTTYEAPAKVIQNSTKKDTQLLLPEGNINTRNGATIRLPQKADSSKIYEAPAKVINNQSLNIQPTKASTPIPATIVPKTPNISKTVLPNEIKSTKLKNGESGKAVIGSMIRIGGYLGALSGSQKLGQIIGGKLVPNTEPKSKSLPMQIKQNKPRVVGEYDLNGRVQKLSNGAEIRPVDSYKSAISSAYSTFPDVPKGFIESVLNQESAVGTNASNRDPGEGYRWFVGAELNTVKDIKKKAQEGDKRAIAVAKHLDFSTKEKAVIALAAIASYKAKIYDKYGNVERKITDPVELYMSRYKGVKSADDKKIQDDFKKMSEYFAI
jgi:hypothetical protein